MVERIFSILKILKLSIDQLFPLYDIVHIVTICVHFTHCSFRTVSWNSTSSSMNHSTTHVLNWTHVINWSTTSWYCKRSRDHMTNVEATENNSLRWRHQKENTTVNHLTMSPGISYLNELLHTWFL